MTEKQFWCLFCPDTAPKFDSVEEMMNHMIDTVHRDESGNIITFGGDKEQWRKIIAEKFGESHASTK